MKLSWESNQTKLKLISSGGSKATKNILDSVMRIDLFLGEKIDVEAHFDAVSTGATANAFMDWKIKQEKIQGVDRISGDVEDLMDSSYMSMQSGATRFSGVTRRKISGKCLGKIKMLFQVLN